MDWLITSVRNLSKPDYQKLIRDLRDQPKKVKLLQRVSERKNEQPDYESLARELGYDSTLSAFYTLKHRLTRDLLEFRVNMGKNEIVKVENRIHNLRVLLYSRDHKLLEKELKELKKRCAELEVTRGQYEINFCNYLLHYHDPYRRRLIFKEMEDAIKAEAAFSTAELEFYRIIFEFQDIFYQGKLFNEKQAEIELFRITEQHNILNNSISEFLLLSAELTFALTLPLITQNTDEIAWKIAKIRTLYISGNIRFRFPSCEFAIECLFNRFYLSTGKIDQFMDSLNQLEIMVGDIVGYKPYEDVLFYFLFAKTWNLIRKNHGSDIEVVIDEIVCCAAPNSFSDKFLGYLYHLKAYSFLYQKKYSKAEGYLIRSRQLKSALDEPAFWLEMEYFVLQIAIAFKQHQYPTAEHHIIALKRWGKQHPTLWPKVKQLVKESELFINNPLRVWIDFIHYLNTFQEQTGLLQLLKVESVFL